MFVIDQRPLILKFADFPLIAMLIGVLLFAFAAALGLYLDGLVPEIGQPANEAAYMAINILLLLGVYKLAIARLGERPHDDLPLKGAFANLGAGILIGALLYVAVVVVAAMLGVYQFIGPGDPSSLVRQIITNGIIPGFMEELLFRGILLRWLEEFAGSWIALLITSFLFGLAHILNPGATIFSTAAIAVESLLLGGAYILTRSLWMPIGLHAAWNITQGAIFGIAVSGNSAHGLLKSQLKGPAILSGGAFGLEGSIIAVIIAAGAGVWLILIASRRGEIVAPLWARTRAL